MPYGIIKVDQVTFTNAGVDQTISVSGIVASISGNITATGTISGNVIRGGTTVSGATVTGTAGQFGTITGNTAGFTTVTGTTITGTTLTVASGTFTGNSTAAAFIPTGSTVPTNGVYLPSANNVAISTNGSGRLFVDASGLVGVGTSSPGGNLDVRGLSGTTIIRAVGADTNGNADAEIFSTGTTGNSRLYFSDTAAQSGSIIYSHSANSFSLATNANTAVTIDSSQRVGVGTTSPGYKLTVQSDSTNTVFSQPFNNYGLVVRNDDTTNNNYAALAFATRSTTAADTSIAAIAALCTDHTSGSADGELGFFTTGAGTISERARIDSSGRLGIGTSAPTQTLHVENTNLVNPSLTWGANATQTIRVSGIRELALGVTGAAPYDCYLQARTNASTAQALLLNPAGGNVGIGTSSPSQLLTLQQTSAGAAVDCLFLNNSSVSANTSVGISFGPNTSNTTGRSAIIRGINESGGSGNATGLQFLTNPNGGDPTEKARLDSSGRLLVGTSSARSNFVTATVNSAFQIEGAGGDFTNQYRSASLTFNINNTQGPNIFLAKTRSASNGGVTVVQSGDEAGAIYFCGADGTNLPAAASIISYIDGTPGANDMPGRLVFSTTADGASGPTEAMRINNQREVLIGTNTRTANGGVLQVSNGITFPATQSACSNANTLDDYEEGTWTCTLKLVGGTGNGQVFNPALSTYSARYAKVGKRVYVDSYMRWNLSAIATNSWTFNSIEISLPFTAGNLNGEQFSPVHIGYVSNFYAGFPLTNNNFLGAYVSNGGAFFVPTVNNPNGAESLITNAVLSTSSSAGIMFQCTYET